MTKFSIKSHVVLTRAALDKIIKPAQCCATCGNRTPSDGIFNYCGLVRTAENKFFYPVDDWKVCEHWMER